MCVCVCESICGCKVGWFAGACLCFSVQERVVRHGVLEVTPNKHVVCCSFGVLAESRVCVWSVVCVIVWVQSGFSGCVCVYVGCVLLVVQVWEVCGW